VKTRDDYPCAEFGDFSFSRFGFIMRTNTHTHTHSQTNATKRFTLVTVVGADYSHSTE